jgi:Domain of unknown function (DUF6894)
MLGSRARTGVSDAPSAAVLSAPARKMPRFYFHIEDGTTTQVAEVVEIDSLAAAKCEAVRFAGQMICDSAGRFWDTEEWKLTATDESGLTLFCLVFIGTDAPVIRAELVPPPVPSS